MTHKGGKQPLTNDQLKLIRELWLERRSTHEIGRILQIHRGTIARFLAAWKLREKWPTRRVEPTEYETIQALHDSGSSYRIIAELYGVSKSTIAQICRGERNPKYIFGRPLGRQPRRKNMEAKRYRILVQRNFHNVKDYRVKPLEVKYDEDEGLLGLIRQQTLNRIAKHFCGIADCQCGSSPSIVWPVSGEYPDKNGMYWISIEEEK